MYGDSDQLENPVAGTYLDRNRRMYLAGGMGAGVAGGNILMNDAPEEHNWDGGQSTGSGIPIPGGGEFRPVTGSPTNATAQPVTAQSNEDDQDWQNLQHALESGMDDTPSNQRIQQLQGQLDQITRPQSLKHRLLNLALEAAPTAAGAIFGGTAGAAGASNGTVEEMDTLHQQGMERQGILRGQIEAERQRQERQYERRLQLPITLMNARMLRDYRQGMVNARLQHEASYGRGMDIRDRSETNRENKTSLDYINSGLDPTTHQPLPPEKLSMIKQGQLQLDGATIRLKQAQADLADARARGIPEQIRTAEQRMQQAGESHNLAMQTFMRDTYGLDMGGDPIPGAPMDDAGNVYGFKAGTFLKPSAMEQSRGGQGEVIMEAGDNLIDHINKHKDKIGDVGAIINSAFLGTPLADEESARLAAEISSYAALQPALHGFRGQDALNEFMKMIGGLPKNPDALIAAIQGIRGTATVMADKGKMKTYTPGAASKLQKQSAAGGGAVNKLQKGGSGGGEEVEMVFDPKQGKYVPKGAQ